MQRTKSQAERLIDLDHLLKSGRYPNCAQFAKKWEVSSKTIQRDIDFLRDRMGAPIEYDPHRHGYYYREETFMLPALQLKEGELVSLLLAARALKAYQGTPVAESLTRIFEKLSNLLPDSIHIRPEDLFSRFTFVAPPSMPIEPEIWRDVVRALQTRHMLKIEYKSAKGVKQANVSPVHLANLQGDWYLFAQYEDYDNFRQLAMSRIQSAAVSSRPVSIRGDFDVEKELRTTFSKFAGENESFEVNLEFDQEVADEILSRQWHPRQTATLLKDGRVRIRFEAKGDLEVTRWILAFGRHVKVISPSWLKDNVKESAHQCILESA
ncbi:MAG: WYL domain-containing protein [Verrucomicrobia bacterium]|nr:WYL domain-containing protein [Verrucomicrobiota bacterium]MCH8527883.1 WYL domain-containing protein [Kiritimatiellia bacterium]